MGYTSKCYVYYGPGDVRAETWDLECGSTEVLLRVMVCGRCGTDRRLFTDRHPGVNTPTVLGHELVGRIVEVGSEVVSLTEGIGYKDGERLTHTDCLTVGRRVTVQSRIARHRDGLMLMRDPIANLSFREPGGFAQYMKVTETMIRAGAVLPVPDTVSDEDAALCEPAACALESIYATPHAVGVEADGRHIIHSGIKPGGHTLIIGSGTLAMIYGKLARTEGAETVHFMVRSEAKARLLGQVLGDGPRFTVVPDYSAQPLSEKRRIEAALEAELLEMTDGHLFDDVVLACPSVDAQRLMFRLLAPDGYGVASCFAGLHQAAEQAEVDMLHYRMGKAVGMSGCSTRTMEAVLCRLAQGELSFEGLTCPHHYTLADAPDDFFQTVVDGRKPMLYPWE